MAQFDNSQLQRYDLTLDDLIAENLSVNLPQKQTTPTQLDAYSFVAGGDNSPLDEVEVLSEFEKDILNNRPYYFLVAKYGEDFVNNATKAIGQASAQYYSDVNRERSAGQILNDTVNQIANAAQEGIGNTIAFGAGLINDQWGEQVNRAVQEYMESSYGRGKEGEIISEAAWGSDRARNARVERANLASKRRFEWDVANGMDVNSAQGKRVIRDVATSITDFTEDSRAFGNVVAQGAGSLGTAIVTGSGIKSVTNVLGKIGQAAKRSATADALGIGDAITLAAQGGNQASWFLSNALIEGSSSAEQVRSQILDMSYQDLIDNSPKFLQRAVDIQDSQDISFEEAMSIAKRQLADEAANYAFRHAGMIAGASSYLTRGLEKGGVGNPLKEKFVSSLGESVEEGIQGISQIYQNRAIQEFADANQDILEGVGRNIGEGFITGAPIALGTQAPSVISDAASFLRKEAQGAVEDFNARKEAEREEKTVLSTRNVLNQAKQQQERVPELNQKIDQAVQDESVPEDKKVGLQEIKDKYSSVLALTEKEKEFFKGSKVGNINVVDRPSALVFAANAINNAKDSELTDTVIANFIDLINPIENYIKATGDVDTPLSRAIASTAGSDQEIDVDIARNDQEIRNTFELPIIQNAYKRIQNKLKNLKEEDLNNLAKEPITQDTVNKVIQVGSVNPDALSPELMDTVLKSDVLSSISPDQQRIISMLGGIAKAKQDRRDAIKQSHPLTGTEQVTENVETGLDPAFRQTGKFSAVQHVADIVKALKNNDISSARSYLNDLGMFVEAMDNKVKALNESYKEGGTKKTYITVTPDHGKVPFRSQTEVFYNPKSQKSLEVARNIALNTKYLAQQYNTIVDAFPELGLQERTLTPLIGFENIALQPNRVITTTRPVTSEIENTQKNNKVVSEIPNPEPTQEEKQEEENYDDIPPWEDLPAKKQESSEPENVYSTGSDGFNVSTKGNELGKKFSAFNAKLDDGRSIEEHYQVDVKGYSSIREGKGKPSKKTPNNQLWDSYLNLWRNWASKNPDLMAQLRKEVAKHNNHLYDPFAKTENNQARALATLLNEGFGLEPEIKQEEDFSKESQQIENKEEVKEPEQKEEKTVQDKQSRLEKIKYNVRNSVARFYFKAYSWGFLRDDNSLSSNLAGINNAISVLTQKIFKSRSALERMLQYSSNKDEVLKLYDNNPDIFNDWSEYITSISSAIIDKMNDRFHNGKTNIDAFFKTPKKKDQFFTGNNRIVLLVQQNEDGSIEYNPDFLQQAVLASIQWLVSNPNTKKDIDDILLNNPNINPEDAFEEYVLTHGSKKDPLINGLAEKIRQYWGTNYKIDEKEGLNEAIVKSLASEIIASMAEIPSNSQVINTPVNLITRVQFNISTSEEKNKTVNFYITNPYFGNIKDPRKTNKFTGLDKARELLDKLVLNQEEKVSYWNNDKMPIAKRILHSAIKLSKHQRQSIANRQKVAYKFNMPLIKVYEAMGLPNILSFFGSDTSNPNQFNENDLVSKEGSNSEIVRGVLSLENDLTTARTFGMPIEEVTRRYAYGISKVGRFQQIGSITPQGNKFTREVIISTESTVDLTDQHTRDNYYRAIAQGFGMKVHNVPIENICAFLEGNDKVKGILQKPEWKRIENFFALAQEEGRQFNAKSINELKGLFNSLGIDTSFVAFHCAMDLAKFHTESEAQRKKHHTFVYLEADGATNGFINALMLSALGAFTQQWVDFVSKGGVFFGAGKRSLADIRQNYEGGKKDVYETIADELSKRLSTYLNASTGAMKDQINSLLTTFTNLTDKVSYTDVETLSDTNGNILSIGRDHDLIKNPVTTVAYGVGQRSLSSKITRSLVKGFYGKCSEALHNLEKNPNLSIAEAFFPNEENKAIAQERFDRMMNHLNKMVTSFATIDISSREKQPIVIKTKTPPIVLRTTEDLRNLRLNRYQFENFSRNVSYFYASNLLDISKKAFDSASEGTSKFNEMNQILSLIHRMYFRKILQNKLDSIKDSKIEGLSIEDKREIFEESLKYSQIIQSAYQNLMANDSEYWPYIKNFFGSYRPGSGHPYIIGDAVIEIPAQAGVKAIPGLNIGFGDGLMMLLLSKYMKTLDVFDGFNMSIDQIDTIGLEANRVVNETWKGNIYKEVYKTANRVISSIGSVETLVDEIFNIEEISEQDAIVKAILGMSPNQPIIRVDGEMHFEVKNALIPIDKQRLISSINSGLADLKKAAIEIDARHLSMQEAGMSVDQMASSENVFLTNDNQYEDTVEELNKLYEKNLKVAEENFDKNLFGDPEDITSVEPKKETIKRSPKKKESRPSQPKVKKMSKTSIIKLMRTLSPEQKKIYSQINSSKIFEGFTVISGDRENLYQYAKENGENVNEINGNTKGWFSPKSKTIYLVGSDATTLLHEMIHATTVDSVYDYYRTNGKNLDSFAKNAVARLDQLMREFINLQFSETEDLTYSISDLQSKIKGLLDGTPEGNTKALNEFMAYSLTTPEFIEFLQGKKDRKGFEKFKQQLAELTNQQKVNWYITYFKKALALLKRLIFGSSRAPQINDSVLSQIQFNTAVLLHRPVRTIDRLQNLVLKAEETGQARLAALQEQFNNLIASKLNLDNEGNNPIWEETTNKITSEVTAAFPEMTAEQKAVFGNILQAFMVTKQIHGGAISAMNRIYDFAVKNLKAEDFVSNPNEDEAIRTKDAQDKYNFLLGFGANPEHSKFIVPVFFALGLTSDVTRDALKKYAIPRIKQGTSDNRLDSTLEALGNTVMNFLSDVAGGSLKSANIQHALDLIANQITKNALEKDSVPVTLNNKFNEIQDIVVDGIQTRMDKANKYLTESEKIAESFPRKFATKLGIFVTSFLGSEKNYKTSLDALSYVFSNGMFYDSFMYLMSDLLGRTESIKDVYDLIKPIKALVQRLRTTYRTQVPQVLKNLFDKNTTEQQYTDLYNGLAKTDIGAFEYSNFENIINYFGDHSKVMAKIRELESQLKQSNPKEFDRYKAKMEELADYMLNGKPRTNNLLRNAYAIERLLGEGVVVSNESNENTVKLIDQLTTLYAIRDTKASVKQSVISLAQQNKEGVAAVFGNILYLRKEEAKKTKGIAKYNAYKGYIPSTAKTGYTLKVVEDSHQREMEKRGFIRIGDYRKSSLDRSSGMGYYFCDFSNKPMFNEGIMQITNMTANGVDLNTGFSTNPSAGFITSRVKVKAIAQQAAKFGTTEYGQKKIANEERLIPVFDEQGQIFAYERTIDKAMEAKLEKSTNLPDMLGIWAGRQIEEKLAKEKNKFLIQKLYDQWNNEEGLLNKKSYVNVFEEAKTNPVLRDAVNLLNQDTLEEIENVFGSEFMVRRDQLDDVLGIRTASVTDIYTGVSYWSPETLKQIRKYATFIFRSEDKAYEYLLKGEKAIQYIMASARKLIIVKSAVVPLINIISNLLDLKIMGCGLDEFKEIPSIIVQIEEYLKSQLDIVKLETQLNAAVNEPHKKRLLEAQLKAKKAFQEKLDIWPLIKQGEFSTVADVGLTTDELELANGNLTKYLEKAVDKLPEGVKTVGRYLVIAQDTPLYTALNKSVQYGDFVAKVLLYKHLLKEGKSQEEALGLVKEHFVDYDKYAGRTRQFLENSGLMWFYSYKLRVAKTAMYMLRNKPLASLLSFAVPTDLFFGTIGSPLTENVFSKFDDLLYTLGINMGLRAPTLNPWYNLVN